MIEIDFERLQTLGLTPALAARALGCAKECADDLGPERVADLGPERAEKAGAVRSDTVRFELLRLTELHRDAVRLHDAVRERTARALPRLIRALEDGEASDGNALAVGDWVIAAADAHGQTWVHARVPPNSHITRRDAEGRRHAVVSNVDTALIVMGLDDDFSVRRLERYVALVQASVGAITPAVVLTKADVIAGTPGVLAARIDALKGRVSARIDVFAVDGTDAYATQQLAAYLGAGQTLVLLGSSGAGKSTLTNTLLGRAVQDTGAVRAHDHRGQHTTTARSLHRLPGGACVIDTPGLRALRPDVDEATLTAVFDDIETLAARCRFRDCAHHDEPGCAVREGVAPDRLRNYHKLLREARRDTLSLLERQRLLATWKARGRESRERLRIKRNED